jgi:hypothetical protein
MLGAHGKKLRTHSMQIDRTDNKGFIATHQLRDRDGNPPSDGQRSQKVYGIPTHEELAAHVIKHLGPPQPPEPPDEDDEPGPPPPPQAAPPPPPPPGR